MADTHPPVVLAPLKLDAFVLNESLCKSNDTFKIAPITQPNYTFLRLTDSLLAADVLDHVDLHTSTPATLNSRLTDLGTGQIHSNRLGVYLKWTLPPAYRTGAAAASLNNQQAYDDFQKKKAAAGYPSAPPMDISKADTDNPQMRPVPNRWLVVRRLDVNTMVPKDANIPAVQAWLIESNRLHSINDPDLAKSDLEVDVVPFVDLTSTDGTSVIDGQAEVFLGSKTMIYPTLGTSNPNSKHVKLDVLGSANPLFADYQPHNSNVFSMLDDFSYGSSENPSRLTEAHADYQVIGWHADSGDDPFTTVQGISPIPSRDSRLKTLQMRLKAPTIANPDTTSSVPWIETPNFAQNWLGQGAQTNVLSHATMYGVHWKSGLNGLPGTVLADAAAQNFKKQPISVGTTALDALYAYCRVHDHTDTDPDLVRMEKDLEALHNLLKTSEDDDVDALQAAQDETFEQAFTKYTGETHWYFHANTPGSNQPVVPDDQDTARLLTLNGLQRMLDMCNRELGRAKWELFAAWWNFVSGWAAKTTAERVPYRQKVTALKNEVGTLKASSNKLQDAVTQQLALFGNNAPQKGTGGRFYQRKDPTVMFGGIKSGWETDFSDVLPVRVADQVVTPPNAAAAWGITNDVFHSIASNLPSSLSSGAAGLLSEFQTLSSPPASNTLTGSQTLPWFYPDSQLGQTDRSHWNDTQPWQPLFIEWEAIYTHIPWSAWKLQRTHQHSQWGYKTYKYAVTADLSANPPMDQRTVSGRVLILPQTSSTLKNTLDELFKSTNANDLETLYGMNATEQAFALSHASNIEFVSSPLTGLTSHLLTLQPGSHLKPTINLPSQKAQPIQAATAGGIGDVGFIPQDLLDTDTSRAETPYGATAVDTLLSPLKIMTHGQLMFTKLNVIDKFGQAICAIDPSPRHRRQPIPTISPCLGDSYFPDLIGVDPTKTTPTGRRNTVLSPAQVVAFSTTDPSTPANDQDDCPFIQLTPAINLPARINASFCVKNPQGVFQACTEWQNPIWGWLVVNYADYGLQVFLQDGTFYREVRLGGPSGASSGLKWLPFDPPQPSSTSGQATSDIAQLDRLIAKLTAIDPTTKTASYMEAFFAMIEESIEANQSAAPSSYSTFASAIVGKPLALVNVGYSMELYGPEPKNWSLVNDKGSDVGLLLDPSNPNKPLYSFNYKLGDVERTYDGLVGYFKTTVGKPSTQADYDLTTLYTFFTGDKNAAAKTDPRSQLDDDTAAHFEVFHPYWTGVPDTSKLDSSNESARNNLATQANALHHDQMQVFGALMDPFLPIHAYSAVLPNIELKLPSWTVEGAMSRMTAFWHAGPLVVTTDVPAVYNANAPLNDTYSTTLLAPPMTDAQAAKLPPQPLVSIPLAKPLASASSAEATYKWLQPYWVQERATGTTTGTATGTSGQVNATKFNAIDISGDAASGADASNLRLESGPYTALEGFIQLAKPIVG